MIALLKVVEKEDKYPLSVESQIHNRGGLEWPNSIKEREPHCWDDTSYFYLPLGAGRSEGI